MANNIMHIYMPQEDIDKLATAAEKEGLSLAAVVRGAIYHVTNNLTDFSGMKEWANLRSRGKPRVTTSTGSLQNDVSWDLLKRNMSGQTARFLEQLQALEAKGLTLDEAIELALVTEGAVDGTEEVELAPSLSAPEPRAQARAEGDSE